MGTPHVGSHGLNWGFVNGTSWTGPHDLDTHQARETKLLTEFETPYRFEDNYGTIARGWFVPPKTTNYRFWMACDDQCYLDMGLNTSDPLNVTRLTWIGGAISYRDYINRHHDRQLASDWLALEEGQMYYIEGSHAEGGWGDHFTVSVEIEQNDTIGHHNSMKEVQYLEMHPEEVYERTQIEISNPDSGNYRLVFTHPTNFTNTATGFINADASARDLDDAINAWYDGNIGSGVWVTKEIIDPNANACNVTETNTTDVSNSTSNETQSNSTNSTDSNSTSNVSQSNCTPPSTDPIKAVYNITLNKLISGVSTSSIMFVPGTTQATATIRKPADVQLSAEPLSGKFRVVCNTSEGIAYSEDISYSDNIFWVKYKVQRSCPSLMDKIEMWEAGGVFDTKSQGRSIYIRFTGKTEPQGLYSFTSGLDTPLGGTNVQFHSNVSIPFNNNLFYEPVPFDMLRTYETKPQIVVSVNGEPAVCHNMTCDYTYVEPVGEVTSFTWTDAQNELTIVGSDLPTNASGIRGIMFAKSPCSVSSVE